MAAVRKLALLNLPDARAGLVKQTRELGIEIDDGMEDAY